MSRFNAEESTGGRGQVHGSKSNTGANFNTPPSPRRSWIKMGVIGRARSVENMHPMGAVGQQSHLSPRPKSPPLTLTTGSPGVDGTKVPMSPLDTPPKKVWETGFKSFLSRRSQQPASSGAGTMPEVPLIAPVSTQRQKHTAMVKQKQPSSPRGVKGAAKGEDNNSSSDQSVRGGKIFQSIFGGAGHYQRKERRKTKSLNELDEPMRNGKAASPRCRRVQSQANVVIESEVNNNELDLSQSLRRASYAGTTAGAIVPPPMHPVHHLQLAGFLHQNHNPPPQQQQNGQHQMQQHNHLLPPRQQQELLHQQQQYPTTTDYNHHYQQQSNGVAMQLHHRQQLPYPQQPQYQPVQGLPIPNTFQSTPVQSGGSYSSHSMSPSSATTEIKKAFTEFHNSSRYARDSTSAYLGDEPSTRNGDAHCSVLNPGLVAQNKFVPGSHYRHNSARSIDMTGGSGRFWGNPRSLPTVDENVSIHKSMRMLRPFQMAASWQAGRRYLIGPAALATCPLLQGISSLSLKASYSTRNEKGSHQGENDDHTVNPITEKENDSSNDKSPTTSSPARLPPVFGCIILGKALLSYVVQEPSLHHHQQRWWSSSILVLRQNYLLEYDQQSADESVHGLPRGYAHLQHSVSYAHTDFADALELEFFVSPCAKADKRVLTIRLQESREKRDTWISCLNRAAQINVRDFYDYNESAEVGRGRYAAVFPARRRAQQNEVKVHQLGESDNSSSPQNLTARSGEYDCALKIIDKKEFWRRVVKGRERADTLVRETSVQATMTTKCSKIPAFVRLRGFFETSDNIVLELELMEGMDLFQYVSSKGVLCEKEAACILRDILTVLDGLNRLGVAHRDIKPANCLMCKAGNDDSFDKAPCVVKVADFGMATFVGVDGLVRGRCGTPGYVAPEIFSAGLHGGYGNKVDVFSAGVTLYVMLCGYEPFYGESDEDLVAANKEAKLDFPKNDWKNVSSEAKDLVTCMMKPDPHLRLSAKEALTHPWIVRHAGNTESVEVVGHIGVDSLSHSIHKRWESCTIS